MTPRYHCPLCGEITDAAWQGIDPENVGSEIIFTDAMLIYTCINNECERVLYTLTAPRNEYLNTSEYQNIVRILRNSVAHVFFKESE